MWRLEQGVNCRLRVFSDFISVSSHLYVSVLMGMNGRENKRRCSVKLGHYYPRSLIGNRKQRMKGK